MAAAEAVQAVQLKTAQAKSLRAVIKIKANKLLGAGILRRFL